MSFEQNIIRITNSDEYYDNILIILQNENNHNIVNENYNRIITPLHSLIDSVNFIFDSPIYLEEMREEQMMQLAMTESMNSYRTQEKKPDVELLIKSTKSTCDNKDEICAVCKSEIEIDNDIVTLECKHVFHSECISEWVKYKSECPVCRAEIPTTFNTEQEVDD